MQQVQSLYVAGPMTGLPNENKEAFHYAEMRLKAAGFTPILPPEMDAATDPEWASLTRGQKYKRVMPKDIAAVASADALFMLPGFEESNGTALEMHAAELFEMEMFRPMWESGMVGLEQWVDETIRIIQRHNSMVTNVHSGITE